MEMAEDFGSKTVTGKDLDEAVGQTDEFGSLPCETTRKSAQIEQKRLAESFGETPDNVASAHVGLKKNHGKVPRMDESWAAAVKQANNDNRSEESPFWITSDANMILDRSGDIVKTHGINKIAVFIPKQEKVEPADVEEEANRSEDGGDLFFNLQNDLRTVECDVQAVTIKEELVLDDDSMELGTSNILVTSDESLQLEPPVPGASSSEGGTKVTKLKSLASMVMSHEMVASLFDSTLLLVAPGESERWEEPVTKRKKTGEESEVEFLKIIGRKKEPGNPEPLYLTIMKNPGSGEITLVHINFWGEFVPASEFLSQKLMAIPRSFENGVNLGMLLGDGIYNDGFTKKIYHDEQAHKPIEQIVFAHLTRSYCGGIDMPGYLVQFERTPKPVWVQSRALNERAHIGGCLATVMSFRWGFLAGMWHALGSPPISTE